MFEESGYLSDLSDEEGAEMETVRSAEVNALSIDEIPYSRDLRQVNTAMPENVKTLQNHLKPSQLKAIKKQLEGPVPERRLVNERIKGSQGGKPARNRFRNKHPRNHLDSQPISILKHAETSGSTLRADATPFVPLRANAEPFFPKRCEWMSY